MSVPTCACSCLLGRPARGISGRGSQKKVARLFQICTSKNFMHDECAGSSVIFKHDIGAFDPVKPMADVMFFLN